MLKHSTLRLGIPGSYGLVWGLADTHIINYIEISLSVQELHTTEKHIHDQVVIIPLQFMNLVLAFDKAGYNLSQLKKNDGDCKNTSNR